MNFDEYKEDIRAAVEVMNRGGVILYPTDTIWGIGCDATNAEAVKRVYEIKKRDDSKALITLVDSEAIGLKTNTTQVALTLGYKF